jgi:queuine tRNA-ribosyltransferase
MSARLSFEILNTTSDSAARAGLLTTLRNCVETPVFMPVATHAIVRGQRIEDLTGLGYQLLLANTYHLLLRPGPQVFREHGDIHSFMQWPASVLTDSGGYQVFSLARFLQMSERGAIFRSYVDGSPIILGPEESVQMQRSIGSDIMMVLDQCIPAQSDWATAEKAMQLTHRWAKRSLAAREDSPQALFGIVQGACYLDLRSESVSQITSLPFEGYALGGLAVGEEKGKRDDIVEHTAKLLPHNSPRYLMGVGTPIDILEAVHRGVDMFDCILPAAFGQQGVCFTSTGKITLTRGVYKRDTKPLDESCNCRACIIYSRAYLHHLLKVGEFVGGALLALHNLTFYRDLMQTMREHIISDTFYEYYREARHLLVRIDDEYPLHPPKQRLQKAATKNS